MAWRRYSPSLRAMLMESPGDMDRMRTIREESRMVPLRWNDMSGRRVWGISFFISLDCGKFCEVPVPIQHFFGGCT